MTIYEDTISDGYNKGKVDFKNKLIEAIKKNRQLIESNRLNKDFESGWLASLYFLEKDLILENNS